MGETMSGEQAWEQVQGRVMAVQEVPARLPRWRFQQTRAGLVTELAELAGRATELGAVYAGASPSQLEGLIASVDALSLAGVWGQTQLAHQMSTRPITEAAERVTALRRRAMRGLAVLESVGIVSRQEAVRLREGAGYVDAASDLQALAPLLRAHWAVLEPLQAHVPDADLRLSTALIDLMPQAAADLISADRAHRTPVGALDWHDLQRRLAALLESDWDQLRALTCGALAALGDSRAALTLRPSLAALDRRA